MHKLTSLLGLSLALVACGVDGSDGGRGDEQMVDWHSGGKADGQSCDFDTMSASSYYAQFAYEKIESETSSTNWYRIGSTWNLSAKLDNGDKVALTAYFVADHRVILEYAEDHYLGGGQYENTNQAVVVTRATIDDATRAITIAGVGTGTPVTVTNNGNCGPGIALTLSSDIVSPGLAGDTTTVVAALSTGFVIDPDHLDQVPSPEARKWFEEDVASGKIKVIRK